MIYCQDCFASQPAKEKAVWIYIYINKGKYLNECKFPHRHTEQKEAYFFFSQWLGGNFMIKKIIFHGVCLAEVQKFFQLVFQEDKTTKRLTFLS